MSARKANIEVNDKELQVAIKGDAKENILLLESYGYHARSKGRTFGLVTGLRREGIFG